ncbi:MAG: LPS-assembly protein LptD, partial [Alphaproteobacteria bacterium]
QGNAKIYKDSQLIISDLIIYKKKEKKIILPIDFTLKDKNNNYLTGSSGFFSENLDTGEFFDVKIKLNDGSRLIGNKGKREKHIDIITKGVYSPCKSRIKIGNFICPTWQLEAEKILHDSKNLFLYQKHSKMRLINTPAFYIPYIVTPSPLRKERKSGFLSPSMSLLFLDTKTSQSLSFPYYFNISLDKELTFTPIINYGGGVDSSQRFIFNYDQILSGGNLSTDLTFDSNFEYENSDKWLNDASLITNYSKNINKNYKLSLNSALQTSRNYIQRTVPDNDLSYDTSLSTNFQIDGYNLNKLDDHLKANVNFYQTTQQNEDNKKTPTVFPNIKYYTGEGIIGNNKVSEEYQFYNIFRDTNTSTHSKTQQKISHKLNLKKDIIKYNSKIDLKAEIYNQFYNTEGKLIQTNKYHSGNLYRLFPIVSGKISTPFKINNDNYNFKYTPNAQLVLSPGKSNSNKISNEDSSNNSFTINNSLNRYSGSDKLDNSKRISYGITIDNDILILNLFQTYEFTNNSNFHTENGNNHHLSDLLGSIEYQKINNINYSFRYDVNDEYIKQQNVNTKIINEHGTINLSYLDSNSKVNNEVTNDTETLNYSLSSNKFLRFSKFNISGLYDLQKDINTEYKVGYSYFDECFGINLDFSRKSYEEDNLKAQDTLTLMFSFKNIGSYKSTNLAVSENDKEDIKWEEYNVDDSLFEIYE